MQPLILNIATSVDGFIAGDDGNVDWLFTDGDYGFETFLDTVGTVVMGRKTHDFMLGADFPRYPGKKNIVFSRNMNRKGYTGVEYVNHDPVAYMSALKDHVTEPIWLVGGGELTTECLKGGVVDHVLLSIHPRLLGSGVPLFPGRRPSVALELTDNTIFDSGLVQLTYAVKNGGRP